MKSAGQFHIQDKCAIITHSDYWFCLNIPLTTEKLMFTSTKRIKLPSLFTK